MSLLDDTNDKVSYLFRIIAVVFRPYLKFKHDPPRSEQNWEFYLLKFIIWAGSWAIVGVFYVLFFYLFIIEAKSFTPSSENLVWLQMVWFKFKSLWDIDVIRGLPSEVFFNEKLSPQLNAFFYVVLYHAVISYAEREYFRASKIHFNLAGLIKVIKLGNFDDSSRIIEQNEDQLNNARKNIEATVQNKVADSISIVSASGWDFFGEGPPLGNEKEKKSNETEKENKFLKWLKGMKTKLDPVLSNGYLLDSISERYRRVRIILLDPESEATSERAAAYLHEGNHKPIEKKEDYSDGIRKCIENLKKARKKNSNIEVKIVKTLPQWKMVMAEGEVWVQPIVTGIRSDHSPLYGFNKTEFSLYHTYFNLFEDLWHSSQSSVLDLSELKKPKNGTETLS